MRDSNNKTSIILAGVTLVLIIVIVAGAIYYNKMNSGDSNATSQTEETEAKEDIDAKESQDEGNTEEEAVAETEDVSEEKAMSSGRNFLSEKVTLKKTDVVPDTAEYKVEKGLANIYNKDLYYFMDEEIKMLEDNYFFVTKPYGNYEFFEVYEMNRYNFESNFVTVDSLMHTYHLFFSHLMKNLEKNELSQAVKEMSENLLKESNSQYEKLSGTEWENAAKRNVEFFAVGTALMGGDVNASFDVSDIVESEVSKIMAAAGIDDCEITDDLEDYTQYAVRGYYEGDETLESYFRAMMWYGRIQFNSKDDDMLKSSMLMNLAIKDAGEAQWKDVYDITAFFAGTSDDLGYYEYYPLIQEIYGNSVTTEELKDNSDNFSKFKEEVKNLRLPEINSIPIEMGEENVIQGFRLMGQRFTIDAGIMQNLIYSSVEENTKGELRMLPDFLDVPAALGSDVAYDLLKEKGDTDYINYKENMDSLRKDLDPGKSEEVFGASLYGNWLNTLRPLLTNKGKGYPMFMQSEAWAKKDIETFAGSYTELKHDTILYSKQVMAEMGSGDIPEYDDRGYVQPEPDVYARFSYLADATRIGLSDRNRIDSVDSENLQKLSELSDSLRVISEKELKDEILTDEEYDLIREYGGILEHFWYDITKADTGDDEINTEKYQAALVVDVATDPNGAVLEMATGKPCTIYVVVNVDGKIKIAKGSVYSFYQFEWPMADRLTDSKWRQMMGFEPDFDGFFNFDQGLPVNIPWWTKDYSYVYEW